MTKMTDPLDQLLEETKQRAIAAAKECGFAFDTGYYDDKNTLQIFCTEEALIKFWHEAWDTGVDDCESVWIQRIKEGEIKL